MIRGRILSRSKSWTTAAGILVLALAASGCEKAGAPQGPTAVAPTPLPSPQAGVPKALVVVSSFTARLLPSGDGRHFEYDIKLILAETGGKSQAVVWTPVVILPSGDRDLGCPDRTGLIEPGCTWDMATLGYCAPYPSSSSPAETMSVDVRFFDDEGRMGSLTSTVAVTR